jgi:putative ABC transport system permease protein
MTSYYLWLAARSLRRNPVLTALMVAAIALGIGAAMTSLTVLRAMSGNPMAHRDDRVYRPQVDNWAANNAFDQFGNPPNLMTYQDSMALYRAGKGERQAAMFPNFLPVQPDNPEINPFMAQVLFTHGGFFGIFDVPMAHGSAWDQQADDGNARVVVLSHAMNERLFGGEDSVGRTLRLDGEDYSVSGVMKPWNPQPRFYELSSGAFGDVEDLFVPFGVGIEKQLTSSANNNCFADPGAGYQNWLASDCIWMAFWVELGGRSEAAAYKDFLDAYVEEQKQNGRFARPLNNRVNTVSEWLEQQRVVSRDAQTQTWLAFAFLLVCLINTVGLLLAKFMARSSEIGLRRAVGASRRQVFGQFLTESAMVGVAGAVIGLGLTWLGLLGVRALYGDSATGRMAELEPGMIAITVVSAIAASLLAGLFPTWRACQVAPALQLKSN